MPLVNASLSARPDDELTARAFALLTDLTVEILGKERGRTTVVVQYVPAGQWARGGFPLAVRGYFVDVKVTAGPQPRHEEAGYGRGVKRALPALAGRASGCVAL